jgi:hypothetical protein
VGEELGFQGDGKREVGKDRGRWGEGGDNGNRSFDDRWWEVLDRDVSKRDLLDNFFKLLVDICILVLSGWGVLELRAYNVSLLGGDGGEDVEEVGWGGDDGGWVLRSKTFKGVTCARWVQRMLFVQEVGYS